MIRLFVLAATALVLLGGGATPAHADGLLSGSDGRHEVCVFGSETPNGPTEGFCVWIPTK